MATRALLKHQTYYIRGMLTERVETLSKLVDHSFMGIAARKEIAEINDILLRLLDTHEAKLEKPEDRPDWAEEKNENYFDGDIKI